MDCAHGCRTARRHRAAPSTPHLASSAAPHRAAPCAAPQRTTPYRAIPRHATPRRAAPRATPHYVIPRHAAPLHATPHRTAPRAPHRAPRHTAPRHTAPCRTAPRHAAPQALVRPGSAPAGGPLPTVGACVSEGGPLGASQLDGLRKTPHLVTWRTLGERCALLIDAAADADSGGARAAAVSIRRR
eukprot:5491288-Prymnesium_polylepis.1